LTRLLYFTLGTLFVLLGTIGVILPVLPTTPFIILALWCYERSSSRFQKRLYQSALFGPSLRRWHCHRVIAPRAKVIAVVAMSASLTYLYFFQNPNPYLFWGMAAVMASAAWYILSKPSYVPVHQSEHKESKDYLCQRAV
jgi:uncharacterized protein